MDAQERRQAIARRLERARSPVSATALAREFSVSRQIIVGDVAILRAGGQGITATPRGYMVQNAPSGLVRQIAVKHDGQAMEAELNAMVDQGCTVLDVIVDHPIYGQLTGPLQQDALPSQRLSYPLIGPLVRAGQGMKVDPLG